MTKQDMKQTLMVCVSILKNLNGRMPSKEELYSALGEKYTEVLTDYLSTNKMAVYVA